MWMATKTDLKESIARAERAVAHSRRIQDETRALMAAGHEKTRAIFFHETMRAAPD